VSVSIDSGAWRLGNHLFQIAAGASLAKDNNVPFHEPEFGYEKYFVRNYDNAVKESRPIFTWTEPLTFNYMKIPYNGPTLLSGYFQSEKYFKHNSDYIRSIFARVEDLEADSRVVNYIFDRHGECCALHVRRGDYLNYPKQHPVMTTEYYEKAISKLSALTNLTKIFVFSDDLDWCRKNLTDGRCEFMDGNSDIVDFHTMTLCDHFIIGNSSFSWWSAWLGEAPNKIVISPSENDWFGEALKHYDMSDLIPEGWITV
jgi:hypothetical protein